MSSESSGVKLIIPPNPVELEVKASRKRPPALLPKTTIELLNRSDFKKKDAKADHLALKYSSGVGALSGLNTKSQKEFVPLHVDHKVRSYS